MGLFGRPNVRKLAAEKNIRGLMNALKFLDDAGIRQSAAIALGKAGDKKAVKPLVKALKRPENNRFGGRPFSEHEVRDAIVQALCAIGDPSCTGPLVSMLEEENYRIRNSAAEVLGHFGDKKAVISLIKVLELQPTESVVKALGQIGDARAVDPLIHAFPGLTGSNPKSGAILRSSVMTAFGKIGDPRAVDTLVKGLADTEAIVQKAAIEALGLIKSTQAEEALIGVLKNGTDEQQNSAADCLKKLNWVPEKDALGAKYWILLGEWEKVDQIGDPAEEALLECLKSGSAEERENAIQILGKLGHSTYIEPLIENLSGRKAVRSAAAKALGEIGDKKAVSSLIPLLDDIDENVRLVTVKALDQLDWHSKDMLKVAKYQIIKQDWAACLQIGKPAIKPLLAALHQDSKEVQKGAAETLGKLGEEQAVAPLIGMLGNKASRENATYGLGQIGAPAVAPLLKLLQDKDPEVSQAAINALGQIGDAAAKALLEILEDCEWKQFYAGMKALIQTGEYAIKPLVKLLQHKEEGVRRAAIKALGDLKAKDAVEKLIPMLNDPYLDVVKEGISTLGKIGDPEAILPLLRMMKSDKAHQYEIVQALDLLSWKPDKGEDGAYYWCIKSEWEKCVKIGPAAVDALATFNHPDALAVLGKIGNKNAINILVPLLENPIEFSYRKAVAKALIEAYQSGSFADEECRKIILAQRSVISKRHTDHKEHISEGYPSDCNHTDRMIHDDSGIGVNFPV